MKKVLITGGAGFIGYHLGKKLLQPDCQIDLVDNLARGVMDRDLEVLMGNPGITFENLNVLDPNAFHHLDQDYDYIYHLAAIIGVGHVLNRPFHVLADNTTMLLNMIDFAKKQKKLKRLVFTSTSEVYAGTLAHFTLPIPTPETTPLAVTDLKHPRTSYMLSKIYGEALCHQSGLPYTLIRPHNFYGPRMGLSHVIPELLKRAYDSPEGGNLTVYSVDHRRTFCYIEDAVHMIQCLTESPAGAGETFNIGNQTPEVTIGELAGLVIKATGRTLNLLPLDNDFGSPVRRCPDMTKTIKLTGFQSQYSLEQGIEHTFQWYRDNVFTGQTISAI